jgi:hypothetical protein
MAKYDLKLNVVNYFQCCIFVDLGLPSCRDEQEIVVSNPFLKTNLSMNSEFDDPIETMQVIDSFF